MIEALKKLVEGVASLWSYPMAREFVGFALFVALICVFLRIRYRLGIKPESGKRENEFVFLEYNRKQALIVFVGGIIFIYYLFLPNFDRSIGCLAVVISLYVLLDTNVLGSTRQASTHAKQAHESSSNASLAASGAEQAASMAGQLADKARISVEEASQKVDSLKAATVDLEDKVKQLLGIDPIPDLKSVVKKLQDIVRLAQPNIFVNGKKIELKTMLLASVPAVGLRGADTEGGHFVVELKAAAQRLKECFQVICYDSNGRKDFYKEERKLTDQTELNRLESQNSDLVTILRNYCNSRNIIETARVKNVGSKSSQSKNITMVKTLPLLDCLHFLIVNWENSDKVTPQAVFWHLDIPQDGGEVNGAGFWTSNRKFIRTFAEVFVQRASDIQGSIL